MRVLIELLKHILRITLCVIALNYMNELVYMEYKFSQLRAKNEIMKKSLEGIGAGFPIYEMVNAQTDRKIIDGWIQNHGLNHDRYKWKYEIGYPVVDKNEAYIRSERGYRVFRGRREWHFGIDINSKYDLRVIACHDGVMTCGYDKIYGHWVIIKNDTYETKYSHLSIIYKQSGVKRGDLIAIMGKTGRASGIHLDFELKVNDKYSNPVSGSTFNQKVEL